MNISRVILSNKIKYTGSIKQQFIWSVNTGISSLLEEFLVEEEDEQIDVDFGFIKHLHHGDFLVLQLQQILHTDTDDSSCLCHGGGAETSSQRLERLT